MVGWIPSRGLVEQQDARAAHQDPSDGQHLLLAAAEGVGPLPAPLAQPRKPLVDPIEGGLGALSADPLAILRFSSTERRRRCAPLRHVAHAQTRAVARIRTGDVLAAKCDAAGHDRQQARDGLDQRRLADPVAADDGDDLARAHFERDLADDRDTAITRRDGIEREFHGAAPTPGSDFPSR